MAWVSNDGVGAWAACFFEDGIDASRLADCGRGRIVIGEESCCGCG